MRLPVFLSYLGLLSLSACTKSGPGEYDNAAEFYSAHLPPYTETGANTLGCRIGAQPWTVLGLHEDFSFGRFWSLNVLEVNGLYAPGLPFFVRGQMTGVRADRPFYDTQLELRFFGTDTLGAMGGLRLLGTDSTEAAPRRYQEFLKVQDRLGSGRYYSSSSRRPVRLQVRRLDRQARTVSGTFAGWVYNAAPPFDSLEVSEGRFDLRY